MFKYLKHSILLLSLPLGGCSCDEGLEFQEVCPQPAYCYIDDAGEVQELDSYDDWTNSFNVGPDSACSLGTTYCNPSTKVISCEGYVHKPFYTKEECNGIDDNCDGEVDDHTTALYWEEENECTNNSGACIQKQICVDGQLYCQLVFPEECGKEVCDGIDNDGDGAIDEDTLDDPLYPERYAYEGPEETDLVGECRPGVRECVQGVTQITGQVLPTFEICGDYKDNDCDGFIDEVENPNYIGSYVFVLDVSGSMYNHLQAVGMASCSFSQNQVLGNSKFAVILIGSGHPGAQNEVIIGLDFTDSVGLCEYMTSQSWMGGGWELQIEGALVAHRGNYPIATSDNTWETNNALSWPVNIPRKIIIFSDEELQTLEGQTTNTLISDCQANSYTLGVFTYHQAPWVWPVGQCGGGFIDTLYSDPWVMEHQMLGNLTGGC